MQVNAHSVPTHTTPINKDMACVTAAGAMLDMFSPIFPIGAEKLSLGSIELMATLSKSASQLNVKLFMDSSGL